MSEPLRVAELRLTGFRNLAPLVLAPGARFNVVHGDNGAGKTSLLEAIDYVATLESFRGGRTEDLVQRGADGALLEAKLTGDGPSRALRVVLHRDAARQVTRDGKRASSHADWRAAVHTVLFHPGDVELPAGPPELRRAFLDRVLGQVDKTYAAALVSYQRALRSRNRVLRSEHPDVRAVTAYDELLATTGVVIGVARERFVDELAPLAADAFAEIAGDAGETLGVAYKPRVAPDVGAMRDALARSLDKDLARGFTAEGVHADELELSLRAVPVRRHASQGQHRAIVLSLKVAELHALGRATGHTPVLLLDDVSSELDKGRTQRLFARIARLGGQIFLTTTQPELIPLVDDRVDLHVAGGVVTMR